MRLNKIISVLIIGTIVGLVSSCANTDVNTGSVLENAGAPTVLGYGVEGGITLLWDEPAGTSSIHIGRNGNYTTVASGLNTYTVTGLNNNKEYTFYIYAEDPSGGKTYPATVQVTAGGTPVLRVMSYFLSSSNTVAENSLRLCFTTDGLNWTAFNDNNAVFELTTIGGNRIRDPYIVKKSDGTYLMIATDWTLYGTDDAVSTSYWSNPTSCLIFADSSDLTSFTNERQIQMVSDSINETRSNNGYAKMYCWAPEVIQYDNGDTVYTDSDESTYQYGVIWSGKGSLDGTSNSQEYTYVNYTNDFETFTAPVEFFDAGYSQIDASVIYDGNKYYYLFYKEESYSWDVAVARSTSLDPASFSIYYDFSHLAGESVTSGSGMNVTYNDVNTTYDQAEGPFCFKPYDDEDLWYLYADCYNQSTFGTWTTTDLSSVPDTWTELTVGTDTSFPDGLRHGSTVPVTNDQIVKMIQTYGL
ncbi:MAG TPA: hypothetical protein DCL73_06165 [Treponema sp.]|nr:hypothetical protein [Treponema sp.]